MAAVAAGALNANVVETSPAMTNDLIEFIPSLQL
jgi:hypothetical protein